LPAKLSEQPFYLKYSYRQEEVSRKLKNFYFYNNTAFFGALSGTLRKTIKESRFFTTKPSAFGGQAPARRILATDYTDYAEYFTTKTPRHEEIRHRLTLILFTTEFTETTEGFADLVFLSKSYSKSELFPKIFPRTRERKNVLFVKSAKLF
jgi:hypothetical protein